MGKLQSDNTKLFILPHSTLKKQGLLPPAVDTPPQIPPRMKKKGPALPEKPPHMRAKSSGHIASSSQQQQQQQSLREPLKPRVLNLDRPAQREVLVAASKSGRERPVEKRQREPAKLLMPTGTSGKKEQLVMPSIHLDETAVPKRELSIVQSKALLRLEEILPAKKDIAVIASKSSAWSLDESVPLKRPDQRSSASASPAVRKTHPMQPVLLIPRNLLTWGSTPISYALWTQRDIGRGIVKPIRQSGQVRQQQSDNATSGTSAVRLRSNSVTRSGSLTSQGSSSSDSGGETFPKSVLKKQRRGAVSSSNSSTSKGGGVHNNRRVDQKKNVTFNAFATVRLMEE